MYETPRVMMAYSTAHRHEINTAEPCRVPCASRAATVTPATLPVNSKLEQLVNIIEVERLFNWTQARIENERLQTVSPPLDMTAVYAEQGRVATETPVTVAMPIQVGPDQLNVAIATLLAPPFRYIR